MPDTERPTPEGLCGTHGQAPYTRDGHCICAAIRAAEAPLRERIAELEREKLLWAEYDAKDRAKTREINILVPEIKAATSRIVDLEKALRGLCNFIGNSLERRSMNSIVLEREWHKARVALGEEAENG